MSVDINWQTLTAGPDGKILSDTIRDFIHEKFQQVPLPNFIQSVRVVSFDLGTVPPDIEIQDITDPYPEFYEDAYTEGNGEGDEESPDEEEFNEAERLKRDRERRRRERREGLSDFDAAYEAASSQVQSQVTLPTITPMRLQPPAYLDHRYPGFRPAFSPAVDQFSTPSFRGPASNLHYFHSALSSSFSGSLTPLASLQQATESGYGWPNSKGGAHNGIQRVSARTDSHSQSPP